MPDPDSSSSWNATVLQTRLVDKQTRRLCKYVAAALLDGSDNRPSLPPEIVGCIFDSGGFSIPTTIMHVYTETPFRVVAHDATTIRQCWTLTETFTASTISRLTGVRLTTLSRHQGWVSLPDHGSWSWFELAVISAVDEELHLTDMVDKYEHVKRRPNGTKLAWISHHHPVEQGRQTSKYDGIFFDIDHEMWTYLSPGDRLGVFGCAVYPGWACIGESAELEFDEYFDPAQTELQSL